MSKHAGGLDRRARAAATRDGVAHGGGQADGPADGGGEHGGRAQRVAAPAGGSLQQRGADPKTRRLRRGLRRRLQHHRQGAAEWRHCAGNSPLPPSLSFDERR